MASGGRKPPRRGADTARRGTALSHPPMATGLPSHNMIRKRMCATDRIPAAACRFQNPPVWLVKLSPLLDFNEPGGMTWTGLQDLLPFEENIGKVIQGRHGDSPRAHPVHSARRHLMRRNISQGCPSEHKGLRVECDSLTYGNHATAERC